MINISFTSDPLPPDFRGDLQDFQERFLLNLTGKISETQVLIGQVGGAMPTTNIGPWLNNDTWYIWNGASYVPTTVKIGGNGYVVQLAPTPTSIAPGSGTASNFLPDRTQILQDKDGTIALTSDIYQGRAAVTLTGSTPTIDWNLGHHFVETLPANTTIKMINSQDGQSIVVALRNNATSFTVTWPTTPAIYWSGGSAPTQTASKTDLYLFYNIGGSIFGRAVQNYT